MGLRLTVQRAAWVQQIDAVANQLPGLIPVVKGNGYGFGRSVLMPYAQRLTRPGATIAVGTVYEAVDVPDDRTALVLTPHIDRLPNDLPAGAVLTVGSQPQADALIRAGWRGAVSVKLVSSMRRYGTSASDLAALQQTLHAGGCRVEGYSIHFPLVGNDDQRRGEVEAWLEHLAPSARLAVSHLGTGAYARLRGDHPSVEWAIRSGTALWIGDRAMFHLTADVLDVRPVAGGDLVGYRGVTVPADGWLVLVAAGTAHGVRALDDGRSPFHHDHRRLHLIEPPHMHTAMLFVPHGETVPAVGDRIDVQRPLTTTVSDELEWQDD